MLHHQHSNNAWVTCYIITLKEKSVRLNSPISISHLFNQQGPGPHQSHEEACPEKHGYSRQEMHRLVSLCVCGCIPVQYYRHHHHHHHHHHLLVDVCKRKSLSLSESKENVPTKVRCWSTDQDPPSAEDMLQNVKLSLDAPQHQHWSLPPPLAV